MTYFRKNFEVITEKVKKVLKKLSFRSNFLAINSFWDFFPPKSEDSVFVYFLFRKSQIIEDSPDLVKRVKESFPLHLNT